MDGEISLAFCCYIVHRFGKRARSELSPGGLHVDEFEAISVIGRDFDFCCRSPHALLHVE
jgi:hypothetical protein